MLIAFSSAAKTARIFEPNNFTLIKQINHLFRLIQRFLADEAEAVFQVRENALFINKVRIKFVFSSFHILKFLTEELKEKEIGTIIFKRGLYADELRQFVVLFSKAKASEENPFEDFMEKVKVIGMEHIALEKFPPYEVLGKKRP